jgi:hypothetical protein
MRRRCAAPSAPVKEALTKALDLYAKLAESRRELGEASGRLEALGKDQARLRENLRIIPPSSEPYKTFLQKFVAQEMEIENLQRQERQLRATVQRQQRDVEAFVTNLTADDDR